MTRRPSPSDFDRALHAIGVSLFFSALCPFLLYRILESRFPPDSVKPLLYATALPVVGLLVSFLRRHRLDAIAVLAMLGIAIHIAVTQLTGNGASALIVRSLDGVLIGVAFVLSALIGRPILLLVARQLTVGEGSRLERLAAADARELFVTVTMVWGIALMAMSTVHAGLAVTLPPPQFLLVSPVLGVATGLALVGWTARFLTARLRHDAG